MHMYPVYPLLETRHVCIFTVRSSARRNGVSIILSVFLNSIPVYSLFIEGHRGMRTEEGPPGRISLK